MVEKDLVLVIDKPHFVVRLYSDLLEVDLKKGARKELEDFLEAKPFLRESFGVLFQGAVPLDVPLRDIKSASVDRHLYPHVIAAGWSHAKIVVPHRKDIVIPLAPEESERLVGKLNELVAAAKRKK